MRISDWSSDVCSSDLVRVGSQSIAENQENIKQRTATYLSLVSCRTFLDNTITSKSKFHSLEQLHCAVDRKSVVQGKSVSVGVDIGGRRIMKKKIKQITKQKIHNTTKKIQ